MKNITKELKDYIVAHDCRRSDCVRDWHTLGYDGRMKMFKGISRVDFENAQSKHFNRIYIRINDNRYDKSALRRAYECIKDKSKPEHGNYQKIAVRGHKHLWLVSPIYGHADYNKAMLMEIAGHERECEWLIAVSRRIANINY